MVTGSITLCGRNSMLIKTSPSNVIVVVCRLMRHPCKLSVINDKLTAVGVVLPHVEKSQDVPALVVRGTDSHSRPTVSTVGGSVIYRKMRNTRQGGDPLICFAPGLLVAT